MPVSKSEQKRVSKLKEMEEKKAKVAKTAHVPGERQKPKYEYPGGFKTEKEFLNSLEKEGEKEEGKAELTETVVYG